jgi:hypothetical protein
MKSREWCCLLAEKVNGQRRNEKDKAHKLPSPDRTWKSFSKFPLIFFKKRCVFQQPDRELPLRLSGGKPSQLHMDEVGMGLFHCLWEVDARPVM